MDCYLCGSRRYIEILDKDNISIWINTDDETDIARFKHRCILIQCRDCGHIYQPVDSELRKTLKSIYSLPCAPGPASMGEGNWGLERANVFLDKLNLEGHSSAIEIGCASGYILTRLKESGFRSLIGIDPSINESEEKNGISFLKEFADERLFLPQKYDLIFSNAVFEHIENIDGVIKFCRNNLATGGKLFFSVPNTQRQLCDGDPGLFLHQHVHYFTEASLRYLLDRNGFRIKELLQTESTLDVWAVINESEELTPLSEIILYDGYKDKLEKALLKTQSILDSDGVIVHGANNALNNILGFLGRDFVFELIDNDRNKHGKRYFNRVTKSTLDIKLKDYNTLLITTLPFYDVIRRGYVDKGFKGSIKNAIAD